MKYYLFFFFTHLFFNSFSQGTITGTVHDQLHHSVPFASVNIGGQYSMCNDEGVYILKLNKKGMLKVSSDAFGYLHFEDSIRFSGKDTIIDIHLSPDAVELDSIVLRAKKDVFFQKNKIVQFDEVTKDQLNKERSSSLSSTLESITGVNAVSVSASVTKPIIRGLQHYRLTVIEDNITQEGQQWGDDHGLELNAFSVENIKIYKGVSALQYHSGVGGTIVSERFKLLPRDDHKASAQFNYESVNNAIGTDAGVQGNVDGMLYKVTYSASKYQDYKVPTDSYQYLGFVLPIEKNRLANTSGFKNHFFGLIGLKNKSLISTLSYSRDNQTYGLFSGAEGVPRVYSLDVSNPNDFDLPFREAIHQKIISNSTIKLKSGKLKVDLGFQHNERKEYENPLAHGFLVQDDTLGIHLKLKTYTGKVSYQRFFEKAEFNIGVLSKFQQNDKLKSFDHFVPSYRSSEVGLFTSYKKYLSDKLVLDFGYRLDYIDRVIEESTRLFYYNRVEQVTIIPNKEFDYRQLNSSVVVGGSYQMKQTNVKISVKRFARVPTIAELSANGNHHGVFRFERGDEQLESEKGLSLNTSLSHSRKNLKLSVSPYYTYFSNYIYLSPQAIFPTVDVGGTLYPYVDAGQLYKYTQTRAVHSGLEISADYTLKKGIETGFDVEFLRAKEIVRYTYLPFIPQNTLKHKVKLSTEKLFDETYLLWRNNWYSAQQNVAQNELATPAFYRADLFMGTSKKTKIGEFDFAVQIKNVFNQTYLLHLNPLRRLGIPEPSRNLSFQLVWKFYHHKHHDE